MKLTKLAWLSVAACIAVALSSVAVCEAGCGTCGTSAKAQAKGVVAGTGYSVLPDGAAAGSEAAKKAAAALGKTKPKLVLVFAVTKIDHEKMLAAVTGVFDKSIVYGCSAYNAITQEGNNGTVGVMALGGHIHVASALADVVGKDYQACGKKIGEGLKAAASAKAKTKLAILLGDCHVPSNDKVISGMCGTLGKKFPIVGAAASGGITYAKGKVIGKAKNVGILISGDFKAGYSTLNEGPADVHANKLVAAAGQAFRNAVGADKDNLAVVFAFDCGGRRGKMGTDRPDELKVMQAQIGKQVPIIGFYGSGEMGPKDNDSPSRGVGYHIAVCAISNAETKLRRLDDQPDRE